MATIKEIAELAGVSRGTVDRVLNNRGAVSEQTARKVLDIAKALQYRPNRAGIVLAAQKRNLKIGVILFDNGNPFFDEVLSGVQEKAQELEEYNCCVSISRVGFDLNAQIAAMEGMAAEGASGLILTPCNEPAVRDKINELAARGIPVITTNTDIENSARLAYVGCDFYRSGQTAAGLMHLIGKSPIRAGIITGSMVVESIFTIGGLGTQFVNSINNSDYPLVMATTIFLGTLMVAANLITDLVYKVIDPRINLE